MNEKFNFISSYIKYVKTFFNYKNNNSSFSFKNFDFFNHEQ